MQQVTWRAPDELVRRVQSVAAGEGRSMNDYLTRVLDAATTPDPAVAEAQRVRGQLAQAGLLAPAGPARRRPDRRDVERARKLAGEGTPLTEMVSRDRA